MALILLWDSKVVQSTVCEPFNLNLEQMFDPLKMCVCLFEWTKTFFDKISAVQNFTDSGLYKIDCIINSSNSV